MFDVFVNGTHPLLPWLAFFCAGIVLGRLLDRAWWRPAAVGAGFVLFAAGTLARRVGDDASGRSCCSATTRSTAASPTR